MKTKMNLNGLQIRENEPRINIENIFDGLDVCEATRKDYSARVGIFISFVDQNGFNPQSCTAFKRYLQTRTEWSVSTKNKYLATARVFLKELNRRGLLPFDVTYNIKQFRQSKKHKREGLSDDQVHLLGVKLKFLPPTPRNLRLKAMYALLAFQGLRQIEITRLDVADIDLLRKVAFIHGKGTDDKEPVYLAPATCKALTQYLDVSKLTDGTLFRSLGNRKTERMSTKTITREFAVQFQELGYKKTVHGFRHFYVTELLKGMNMQDVRKFSRHHSLEMLMVYDDEINVERKAKHVFKMMARFGSVTA
ncbi:MAG: tyrosine-type recombinase/integrase [Candidatus Parcubacteria bacterium]|nr:tyrosine-type recombinase/integrase [Candidatus Parcubacteria bacterium]